MASGQVTLDVIRGPRTLGQLRERLREPVHVLHVLCHGDLDQASHEGVLVFEDIEGREEQVNADMLRLLVEERRGDLCLVLLNNCLGALQAAGDPFSSVGAALIRAGLPTVIAMQFEIAESSAAELADIFYDELVAGRAIDLALTKARQQLAARFRNLDWAIPVLFARGDDLSLFPKAIPSKLPAQTLLVLPVPTSPPVPTAPVNLSDEEIAPFTVGPPISHPRAFFGREAIVGRIFGQLRRIPLQNTKAPYRA